MRQRGLAGLVLVTLLAVAAAYAVVAREAKRTHPAPQRVELFPGLKETLPTAAKIEINNAGDLMTLERQDHVWTLPGKDHYPANQAGVAQLLATIGNLTVLEEKTSDPGRYADLALAPPSKETGAGREVKVRDDKGAVLADVVLGRIAVSLGRAGGGFYVRRADDPRSWLAEGAIDIPATLLDWTDRNVFGLNEGTAIRRAVLSAGSSPVVSVARAKPDAEAFTIAPAPPGTPDQGKALRLATAPIALDFTDVRAVTNEDKPSRSATFEGFGGVTYKLDLVVAGKDVWGAASETGAGPAATFTARQKAWLYKLPPYRAEILQADLAGFSVRPDPDPKSPGNAVGKTLK